MFKFIRRVRQFLKAKRRLEKTDAMLDAAFQREIDRKNRIIREAIEEAREEDGINGGANDKRN